jgi:GntR family transcriptional regulator, transcriptional repressor for pyruvate dehydrogenase complex
MLWGIRPVEAQATYGLAVDRLRGQIHAGLLLPDEKLPAERQLAENISISRVTLREALRILETDRYISIKRGALGGAFVSPIAILQTLAVKRIARDPGAIMRVLEFRTANEAAAAPLAALRRAVPELKRMRAALETLSSAPSSALAKQSQTLFMLAIADATHNPFLAAAINQGLGEMFAPFAEQPQLDPEAPLPALYRALYAAIEKQDEGAAAASIAALHAAAWAQLRNTIQNVR